MGLLTNGFWNSRYWAKDYWADRFWPNATGAPTRYRITTSSESQHTIRLIKP